MCQNPVMGERPAGDERFRPVVDEMRRQVESGLRPTIQVAVDWRGKLVLDAAVGDGASAASHYLLWSTTKPAVALALLGLVEEGAIGLDDKVGATIPEFACNGKEAVTVAHLLTHRGGFPDSDPAVRRKLFPIMRDWDAALNFVCGMELAWEPGTARGYHPFTGWLIVGELVQRLDARPLAESVWARVLEPAGVARASWSLGEPDRLETPPLRVETNGLQGAPPEAEARHWSDPATHAAVLPGAGGITRANEYVKLFRALLDAGSGTRGRVVRPETVRLATFPHAVGTIDRTFMRDIPWGLGFHLKHVRPSLDDCGPGATPGSFGHAGHFLVNTAWADPGRDLAVCVLSNGLAPSRDGMAAVSRLSQSVHDVVDAICAEECA